MRASNDRNRLAFPRVVRVENGESFTCCNVGHWKNSLLLAESGKQIRRFLHVPAGRSTQSVACMRRGLLCVTDSTDGCNT